MFNRFYWLEIHSLIGLYFRPSLWTVAPMERRGTIVVYCCLSIFSLTSSPLPKLNVLFIQTVCVWGGGGELCCVEHILQEFTLCFWPDAEPTKLLHHPKQNYQWKRHKGVGVFKVSSSMGLGKQTSPRFREIIRVSAPYLKSPWLRVSTGLKKTYSYLKIEKVEIIFALFVFEYLLILRNVFQKFV